MCRNTAASCSKLTLPRERELRGLRQLLLNWYAANGRSFPWRQRSATNYELVIAELLLQRTRATTVRPLFLSFVRDIPSWRSLARASDKRLMLHLKPLGLWRRRAISMRNLAKVLARQGSRLPRTRSEIESLPGVGQYIANAILLLCKRTPEPLLDVNMARVLERVFRTRLLSDIRYDPYLQTLAKRLVDCRRSKDLNWAILDLGAMVCTSKIPRCTICPLSRRCAYWRRTRRVHA